MSLRSCVLLPLLLVMLVGTSTANDQATVDSLATAEQIGKWIAELDSDTFSAREEASRQLFAAGRVAVGAIAKAATSDSREVSTRAFDLLKRWNSGSDAEAKTAAATALEKLAGSQERLIARRAKAALSPPEDRLAGGPPVGRPVRIIPQAVPAPGGGIQIQGRIQINGARIQIGGAGGNIKIIAAAQNGNGQRTIHVNDGDRQIEIIEDAAGIAMKVTEKVKGKMQTSNYKAKNAAELKKKHPEAYKLYEKHAGKNGVIKAQAIVPQPPAVPKKAPEKPAEKQDEK